MKKALIAMSGGVDSAVSACIMKSRGYECIGCTMKLYNNEDIGISRENTCCSLDDIQDAKSVAGTLGIPHYVFDFSEDFKEKIIKKFASSYIIGKTPNPCIDCNKYMKFDKLFARAEMLGCDCIVTGHYARITEKDGKYSLLKAVDPEKDQSYVLYQLTQELLSRICFPLGEMHKSETRRIAEENGFVNAHKHDSQDICFVPDGNYAKIVDEYAKGKNLEGNFIRTDGSVICPHKGITHYTIGQRRGLGIAAPASLYVLKINPQDNTVMLGGSEELFSREANVEEVNWISGEVPGEPVNCKVKIRYRQKEQPAVVTPLGENSVSVLFDEPQRAITPGQAAVFYDGDTVLGGGVIK